MKTNYDLLDWLGEEAAQNIGNEVEKSRRGSPGPNYQKIIPPFERIEPSNCQKYADKMKTEGERLEGIFGAPLNSFVLPDGIYGESKVFPYEDTADKTYPMPPYSKEYGGATVDKYGVHPITGDRILVQRRVYDTQGFALQDFDYCHSRFRLHFFPHIHIWINRKTRSYAIEYR